MGIIKGPLKLKGFKASQFMADQIMNAKARCNIKLPFEATGFKSTKVPEGIDLSGINFANDQKQQKQKPQKEPVNATPKFSSFKELAKIGGVGPKTVEDLQEMYNKRFDRFKKALEKDDKKLYANLRDDIVVLLKENVLG